MKKSGYVTISKQTRNEFGYTIAELILPQDAYPEGVMMGAMQELKKWRLDSVAGKGAFGAKNSASSAGELAVLIISKLKGAAILTTGEEALHTGFVYRIDLNEKSNAITVEVFEDGMKKPVFSGDPQRFCNFYLGLEKKEKPMVRFSGKNNPPVA